MHKKVETNIIIEPEHLRNIIIEALVKVGTQRSDAEMLSDVMVETDLSGIDSHGVARLKRYVEGIRTGAINARPQVQIINENTGSVLLDNDNGLGQPAGIKAMELAIEKASKNGIGIAIVRNTNHFGIAGYYTKLARDKDMIGIAGTNASPQVAPTHSTEKMYGTNPISIAIPSSGEVPFVIDMSTSSAPRGKIERLRREGETKIPAGWAIDANGTYETNIDTLLKGLKEKDGHALLPLGGLGELLSGHKGFGLGLFIDLICGPIAGSAWGRHVYGKEGANLGQFFIAIDIKSFGDVNVIKDNIANYFKEIKSLEKVKGEDTIYIPGEKEEMQKKVREIHGIPLTNMVYSDLKNIADNLDIEIPLK